MPEDFGFFAVAILVYSFVESISYTGFNQALIYLKSYDDYHLNTLFFVNIVRGVILSALMLMLAYPAVLILDEHDAYQYILGLAITPLITSLHNPGLIAFQKNLDLQPELYFHMSGVVLSLICSVFVAILYPTPWALVVGVIAQQFGQLIASYYLHSFRPKFHFDLNSFKPMMRFGKWVIVSQILKYFATSIPAWTIGSLGGIQALGLYRVSGRLSEALGRDFSKMISSVIFPSFSFLQDSKKKLGEVYYSSQRLIAATSFLLFGLLATAPDRFVYVFLGEKWEGAVEFVFLLSILSLIQNVGSQVEVIKASGNTRFLAMIVLVRAVFIVITVYPAVLINGVNGAIYVVILSALITFPISMVQVVRFTQTKITMLIRIYSPPFFSLGLMYYLGYELDNFLVLRFGELSSQRYVLFVYVIMLLCACYITSLFVLDKLVRGGIFQEFSGLINKRKGRNGRQWTGNEG